MGTYLRTTGCGSNQRGLSSQACTALDCWVVARASLGMLHQDGLRKTREIDRHVRKLVTGLGSSLNVRGPPPPDSPTAWYRARFRMNRSQSVEGAAGSCVGTDT